MSITNSEGEIIDAQEKTTVYSYPERGDSVVVNYSISDDDDDDQKWWLEAQISKIKVKIELAKLDQLHAFKKWQMYRKSVQKWYDELEAVKAKLQNLINSPPKVNTNDNK